MSDIADRVKKIVVEHLGVEAEKVQDNANFIDDLGADSLDTVELVMAFEEEFNVEIPDDAAETIVTVGDAVSSSRRTPPKARAAGRPDAPARAVDQGAGRRDAACRCHGSRDGHAARLRGRADLEEPSGRPERGARVGTFDVSDIACKIACLIPLGDGTDGTFNPDQWMEPKEQRKVDPFIVYAMAAATQALDDADWHPTSYEDQMRLRRSDRIRHRRPRRHLRGLRHARASVARGAFRRSSSRAA